MAKIAILSGSHLCFNPRVMKEATALADAGHDVTVFGARLDAAAAHEDEDLLRGARFAYVPVVDATAAAPAARAQFAIARAARKAAQYLARAGIESGRQLGLTARPLLVQARRFDAGLYIAHSEPALFAARQLMRDGRAVGLDLEDWFSEDLLPEARRTRPLRLLRGLEGDVLRGGVYAACTSQAMADAVAQTYGCSPPAVLYNVFPLTERSTLDGKTRDRRDRALPSIHWYSQTLGPGRGLERLVAALPLMKQRAELHLRGRPAQGFAEALMVRVPGTWRELVAIHDTVPNAQLLSRIAEHDIGFAGEIDTCRSRDLTVTNKILTYLLAGLAVAASDTAGQREIAAQAPDAVSLYPPSDPPALAAALDALLADPGRLRAAKAAALAAAERTFSWERQKAVLLDGVDRALARTRAS
jgi:glycosyltransferase involved in cell wall biosynthesis